MTLAPTALACVARDGSTSTPAEKILGCESAITAQEAARTAIDSTVPPTASACAVTATPAEKTQSCEPAVAALTAAQVHNCNTSTTIASPTATLAATTPATIPATSTAIAQAQTHSSHTATGMSAEQARPWADTVSKPRCLHW